MKMVLRDTSVGETTFRPNSALIDFHTTQFHRDMYAHVPVFTQTGSIRALHLHARFHAVSSLLSRRLVLFRAQLPSTLESPPIKLCRNCGSHDRILGFFFAAKAESGMKANRR